MMFKMLTHVPATKTATAEMATTTSLIKIKWKTPVFGHSLTAWITAGTKRPVTSEMYCQMKMLMIKTETIYLMLTCKLLR